MEFTELYQLLFIGSTLYITYHLFLFVYRFVRRVRYNIDVNYSLDTAGLVILWLSLSIFLAYLI